MRHLVKTVLGIGLVAGFGAVASAQPAPPDPTHIPFTLPKDIPWVPNANGATAMLYGDPSKPGPYAILMRWDPGHFSKPHFHSTDRHALVISGTWWVASGNVQDIDKLYPVPAGSIATDLANTVHYDGNKAGNPPVIFELSGIGPVTTTQVDENGKPKPARSAQ